MGSSRRSTAKAWRPSWPPSKTAMPTDVVTWPRYGCLAPIVAGSGHTSPLGPLRAELGETSIRSFTIGHLLGRHQSLETRPALDGHSARRSATLADAKRRVKRLSEEFSPRSAEAAGPYRTRTWWRRDREVLPAASVAWSTYEKVPRSQAPAEVFPLQLTRWRPAAWVPLGSTRTTLVLA